MCVCRSYKPCDIRGACGPNAKCAAVGPTPTCSCPDGFSGQEANTVSANLLFLHFFLGIGGLVAGTLLTTTPPGLCIRINIFADPDSFS